MNKKGVACFIFQKKIKKNSMPQFKLKQPILKYTVK